MSVQCNAQFKMSSVNQVDILRGLSFGLLDTQKMHKNQVYPIEIYSN